MATALRIPLVPLQSPISVQALDNRPIGTGVVHHIAVPVSLLTQDTHSEQITFLIIDTPTHPVVLGLPWLSLLVQKETAGLVTGVSREVYRSVCQHHYGGKSGLWSSS